VRHLHQETNTQCSLSSFISETDLIKVFNPITPLHIRCSSLAYPWVFISDRRQFQVDFAKTNSLQSIVEGRCLLCLLVNVAIQKLVETCPYQLSRCIPMDSTNTKKLCVLYMTLIVARMERSLFFVALLSPP